VIRRTDDGATLGNIIAITKRDGSEMIGAVSVFNQPLLRLAR